MVRNRTRRDVLRTGTGALAAAGMAGLAGCSGGIPGLGGANYANWLHEPGEIRDTDHYSFLHITPSDFLNNEDELSEEMFDYAEEYAEGYTEPAGLDFDETNWMVESNVAAIAGSSLSKEEMVEELEDNEFDDEADHEGYTVFVPDNENRRVAFATNGDHLIRVGNVPEPADAAEDVIDVGIGSGDRYVDENDAMAKLTDEFGSESILYGNTQETVEETDESVGRFEGMTGVGFGGSINGERTGMKYVFVFEDADEVDTDDVEDWVDENDGSDQALDDVDDVSVSKSGRAAVVSGQMDTDDFSFF